MRQHVFLALDRRQIELAVPLLEFLDERAEPRRVGCAQRDAEQGRIPHQTLL